MQLMKHLPALAAINPKNWKILISYCQKIALRMYRIIFGNQETFLGGQ